MIWLQLRNELWKMFGKKRTYIGFGMFLLAQVCILFLLRYLHGPRREMAHRLELLGYAPEQFMSGLTMAGATLIPMAFFLLPLYAALVGGDLLAKESEEGTLRMILARPISRLRLVWVKWLAGVLFAFLLVLVLGLSGAAVACSLFPSGGLFALIPQEGIFSVFGAETGWEKYAVATFILGGKAVTIMGLALMFSCFNIKPAAATILALSFLLISDIIRQIPYFHDLQHWFITYHTDYWLRVFIDPTPWPDIAASVCILLGFNATILIVGCVGFQMRDIKS
ncbi:MAG TPA: ABC transporter permease subunit [Verrucomicrobiae bacterium]|jgi:ABC-2 type transport system permease protein|nr:ABC transporter permease subunit [Verrucomicrobiae bacterium]